ncbi:hypothetical protein Bbelb_132220 [Branchiostoma belcheri]|nr:hypothetical protein Bbelb_132220 [Branchiostoma belcheri]
MRTKADRDVWEAGRNRLRTRDHPIHNKARKKIAQTTARATLPGQCFSGGRGYTYVRSDDTVCPCVQSACRNIVSQKLVVLREPTHTANPIWSPQLGPTGLSKREQRGVSPAFSLLALVKTCLCRVGPRSLRSPPAKYKAVQIAIADGRGRQGSSARSPFSSALTALSLRLEIGKSAEIESAELHEKRAQVEFSTATSLRSLRDQKLKWCKALIPPIGSSLALSQRWYDPVPYHRSIADVSSRSHGAPMGDLGALTALWPNSGRRDLESAVKVLLGGFKSVFPSNRIRPPSLPTYARDLPYSRVRAETYRSLSSNTDVCPESVCLQLGVGFPRVNPGRVCCAVIGGFGRRSPGEFKASAGPHINLYIQARPQTRRKQPGIHAATYREIYRAFIELGRETNFQRAHLIEKNENDVASTRLEEAAGKTASSSLVEAKNDALGDSCVPAPVCEPVWCISPVRYQPVCEPVWCISPVRYQPVCEPVWCISPVRYQPVCEPVWCISPVRYQPVCEPVWCISPVRYQPVCEPVWCISPVRYQPVCEPVWCISPVRYQPVCEPLWCISPVRYQPVCEPVWCISPVRYQPVCEPVWCISPVRYQPVCEPVWCISPVRLQPVWCISPVRYQPVCEPVWCISPVRYQPVCEPVWCISPVRLQPVWCISPVRLQLVCEPVWCISPVRYQPVSCEYVPPAAGRDHG